MDDHKQLEQLSLLTPEALAAVTDESCKAEERRVCIYTGEQLAAKDPDRFALVCQLLASGRFSWREIRAACRVSFGLISAIIKNRAADIEAVKKEQSAQLRVIADMTNAATIEWLQLLLDDPARIKKLSANDIKGLQTAGAIATDKALLQTGQATERVEVIESSASAEEFRRQYEDLQAQRFDRIPAADVEEIPAAVPGMGTQADGRPTKEGSPAADPAGAADPGKVAE